jgi:putative hydrolase of the HAD superfamily
MNAAPYRSAGVDPDDDFTPFAGIEAWVFDLDDTLYPVTPGLTAIFDGRMRAFIEKALGLSPGEAARVQQDLFNRYGATVRGLMTEHGVTPDEFLAYVHDIDHSVIEPDPALAQAIAALPGRRYILTNSPRRHAERVVERLGIAGEFHDIFDFARAGHHAKPSVQVYANLVGEVGLEPRRTAIFEDLPRNLAEPRRLGMTTVLVIPPKTREMFRSDWDLEAGPAPTADFLTENLGGFLSAIIAFLKPGRTRG